VDNKEKIGSYGGIITVNYINNLLILMVMKNQFWCIISLFKQKAMKNWIVVNEAGYIFYEAISKEDAIENCPIGFRIEYYDEEEVDLTFFSLCNLVD